MSAPAIVPVALPEFSDSRQEPQGPRSCLYPAEAQEIQKTASEYERALDALGNAWRVRSWPAFVFILWCYVGFIAPCGDGAEVNHAR